MDFFSFLPIIIAIYVITTMFSSKNTTPRTPRNMRKNPFPFQETWEQKMKEFERQMFPREAAKRPLASRVEPMRRPSSEGFESDGYTSPEGTSGAEGTAGTEGTSGTEGTPGMEGTEGSAPMKLEPQAAPAKKPQENPMSSLSITEESLRQGVIWAEVLGKPRARRGWSRRY